MYKIIIACDNDNILFSKLSNSPLIELINVPKEKNAIIKKCNSISPDMLILDCELKPSNEEVIEELCKNCMDKYLIISATHNRTYLCFNKTDFLLDLIKSLEEFKASTLDKKVLDMLWKLRFNIYTKGTIYLKDAILLAYHNKSLIYDTNMLVQEVAKIHNLDEKNIRNNIDNAINQAFKYENLNYDIKFFEGYYDGRKVSLKYFIALSVYYISVEMNKKDVDPNLLLPF